MNTAELTTIQTEKAIETSNSSWRDWLGIVASIACAIHCALMPFVIAYLPMLGLSFLADEAFHKWMAVACFLIAIAAFVPGIRRHGSWTPISIGAAGLAVITFAAFGLAGECCPSCEATELSAVVAESDVADSTCESCDQCANCKKTEATLISTQAEVVLDLPETSEKGLLSTLAPWMTPFGGMLLVSAHLLNQRFGCHCECCGGE